MVNPVVGAAIATGAANVLGGWMGGKGASRAARAQAQAQQQALAYQRQRDAIADQRYQQRWDDYKARHAAWSARQGFSQPSSGGGGSAAPAGPQTLGELAAAGIPDGSGAAPKATAADLQGVASQFGTLGDMAGGGSDWTDWRRYGAGVQ